MCTLPCCPSLQGAAALQGGHSAHHDSQSAYTRSRWAGAPRKRDSRGTRCRVGQCVGRTPPQHVSTTMLTPQWLAVSWACVQVTLQRCVATIRHHFGVPPRRGEEATGFQQPHEVDGGHVVGSLGPPLCVGLLTDAQVHEAIFVLKCAALNMDPLEVSEPVRCVVLSPH